MAGFDFGGLLEAALPALIQAGGSYFGNSYQDDQTQQNLAFEQQKFAQQQAFNEKELAQRLAIAQMNAASAGAGSGAAVAAARIKAATDEKAIRQQALEALLQGRLKQAEIASPEQVNSAGQFKAKTAAETGQTGLSAFMALADRLQAPLLRR